MHFNEHFDLYGKHAFLSGSNYSWTNYTPEKLEQVYRNVRKKEEGIELHAFASVAIKKRIKVAPHKKALNMFINDAIGFNMQPEVPLYYSDNCFGTCDAIAFKNNFLQIHDLKTGYIKASFRQLDIYSAIFCLEYNKDPYEIAIEQRIYQGRGFETCAPEPEKIKNVMDNIVEFDRIIESIKYTI